MIDRDEGIYIDRQTNRHVRIRRDGSEEEQGTSKKEERSGGEVSGGKQRNKHDDRDFRNETRTNEETNSIGDQNERDGGNVTTKEKEGKSGIGKGDQRKEKGTEMKELSLAREKGIKGTKRSILVTLTRISKKLRKAKAMSLTTRVTKRTLIRTIKASQKRKAI